jgi:hypothetical protein
MRFAATITGIVDATAVEPAAKRRSSYTQSDWPEKAARSVAQRALPPVTRLSACLHRMPIALDNLVGRQWYCRIPPQWFLNRFQC